MGAPWIGAASGAMEALCWFPEEDADCTVLFERLVCVMAALGLSFAFGVPSVIDMDVL